MSDLISRSEYKSKLVKALDVLNKEYREALLNEDNDLILAIQNQQSAYMIALRLLDNEPTAYDVDKVVYEFESFAKLAEDRWTNGTSKYAYQEHKCWVKAIEIVKQGGVSDDVCEWKSTQINNEWKPSCEPNSTYNVFGVAWFKRCPYCGKKIKVVE